MRKKLNEKTGMKRNQSIEAIVGCWCVGIWWIFVVYNDFLGKWLADKQPKRLKSIIDALINLHLTPYINYNNKIVRKNYI